MLFRFIALLIILSTLTVAQDDYQPWIKAERERYAKILAASKINYPGDSKIDVTYYGLNFKITYQPNYLIGAVTIGIRVDTTSINSLFLDLSTAPNGLIVDSLLLNGSPAVFTHIDNKLDITLDRTYSLNEIFSIIVYYQGLPVSTGWGSFKFGSHNGQPLIWTFSQPYGTSDWFPCKDTPADKVDSVDVWITVDTSLIPVSNGNLESVVNNGDSTHTYKWHSGYPIAHYLISLAIANYREYVQYFKYSPTDSMLVIHYIFPEKFTSSLQKTLDLTVPMLKIFSDRFGLYPFIGEKYGHAQFGGGGGMEHQTITSMGAFGQSLMSHELAHQWYGNKITCRDWHNIWLNEGFATYLAVIYEEVKSGKGFYDARVNSYMKSAKNAQGSIWVKDITNIDEIFNSSRSYFKGALVLHMLRGIVGDETFFNIMLAYSNDPVLTFSVATTEDFQRVAETVYGQSLQYFFQEWIYGENYPIYTIYWNSSRLIDSTYRISLDIVQEINSNPSFFEMPFNIKIYTNSGDTTITLFNNAQTQNFQFEVWGSPDSIVFDPENWILKKIISIVSSIEEISTPSEYRLFQNYPNPFNPVTKIKFSIPSNVKREMSNVLLKVYDILGNEVAILVNEVKPAGSYEIDFNAANLPSGVYFYQLIAGDYLETKKMLLLR
ncbi:MAG: hypothetical protein A2315_11390 [Ignavibacteria bacterium RIFOXYB2_FULL_35_12]|nr:MAG: hypothetical protein A2058_16685 [Ignavibacteria bacterium GWA2_36_19]OGU53389.1 MAG: hypothetical protein A2006_04105 [Ignavibacteria bacterium GWC2_35_8]OGU58099.1 MAG: hypothetical protein A2X60_03280 [Ignavibacteria bacterium GWF2_35_20]OGU77183.1 MAG: hypothetical protein A2W11_10900 [Ignavibacteria bacterium RBG_16_35_7]OGU87565.1 MAG: hypothetical protein A2492_08075 [Ignavibacteria bacterium RIFOXYC12_FULL_35_11]OGU90210.1 MAG: hypothetical protein A3K31_10315 [Ignavibacteria b